MSLYNTTNIKNLPQVDQIVDTDFLVVENYAGTNKLRFKDFVVGPNNTSFYNSIKTSLSELSAYDKTNTLNLSSLSSFTVVLSGGIANNALSIIDLERKVDSNNEVLTSAVEDLNANLTLSAQNLVAQNQSVFDAVTLLEDFKANVYHRKFTFRWNTSAYDANNPSFTRTYNMFVVRWPNKLDDSDVVYVGTYQPYNTVDTKYNYTGTLLYRLSCLYFDENDLSTYVMLITASQPVREELTVNYKAPLAGNVDETPTFVIRVFAAT